MSAIGAAWGTGTWADDVWGDGTWGAGTATSTATGIHTEGGGSSRIYGIPRKKRKRADPEFTLQKPKKSAPGRSAEPPPAIATAADTDVSGSVEAEPTPATELVFPPVTVRLPRRNQTPAPSVVADDPVAKLERQRARDEHEDEETILAWLMSL